MISGELNVNKRFSNGSPYRITEFCDVLGSSDFINTNNTCFNSSILTSLDLILPNNVKRIYETNTINKYLDKSLNWF